MVLTLLAIIAGMAVVSVDLMGPERTAEDQARRLALLIREQCEAAILDTRELGVRLLPDGYRFSVFDGENWHPYHDPPAFVDRDLPQGFAVRVELDGAPVVLDPDPAIQQPHIVCQSSGEMTPFELSVMPPAGTAGYRLSGRRDGRVELDGWSHGS